MAKPLKVEFQFDFGSPNAYLAEYLIPSIERRTGMKFDYVPVLLGGIYKATGNMSPNDSLRGIKNKPEYQALETQRFIRRHNITKFRQNPFFPVNTLMLMRGVLAAQFEGVFEPYFRAAYHHMWEEPKKMDDVEVFKSAFKSSGIDVDRLMARAQQDDVKKRLIELTNDAVARSSATSKNRLWSRRVRWRRPVESSASGHQATADHQATTEKTGRVLCRVHSKASACWI